MTSKNKKRLAIGLLMVASMSLIATCFVFSPVVQILALLFFTAAWANAVKNKLF